MAPKLAGIADSPGLLLVLASLGFAMGLSSLILTMIFQYQGGGGPAGPVGPIGPTGPTGAQGPSGENGTSTLLSADNGLTLTDDGVVELGGALIGNTVVNQAGYNLTIGAAASPGRVYISTGNFYMPNISADSDSSAGSVLVLNNGTTGLVEYASPSTVFNSNGATYVVYTNGVPTNIDTRFSLTFPPTVQDNSLKLQIGVPYCAADGNWYRSDGVTYTTYTYSATRSTVGNHVSMYKTGSQSISNSAATVILFDGVNSVQAPSICPLLSVGGFYSSFTLAPGGIYAVRASIYVTGTGTGICSYAAYLDGSVVTGSTGTTFTWSYSSVATPPTSGVEMFTIIRVPSVAQSLSIRTTGCTGTSSYAVNTNTKMMVQQISVV